MLERDMLAPHGLAKWAAEPHTADEVPVLVESDLTGHEEKTPRCDDPVGVMPGRRRMSRHIDRSSFELFSHPPNLSASS